MSQKKSIKSVGIMGFGAFGRLITTHLKDHFTICVHDPSILSTPNTELFCSVERVASCDVVVLAVPVGQFENAIIALKPHLKKGCIVVDVGSVKLKPVEIMLAELPEHVDIIGTHPLFGPQSAKAGIAGCKVAVCPVRGKSTFRIAAFLKKALGLNVIISTADQHDKEAAVVQGLTHLIARILVRMEPLPRNMTTASFDLLLDAIEMVRHDSEDVYKAIEQENPHAENIRNMFFDKANEVLSEMNDAAPLVKSA